MIIVHLIVLISKIQTEQKFLFYYFTGYENSFPLSQYAKHFNVS